MAHKMDVPCSDGGQHGEHVIHERLQGEVPGEAGDGGRARVPGVVGDHAVASGQITDGRQVDLMVVRIAVYQQQRRHVRSRLPAILKHGKLGPVGRDGAPPFVDHLHAAQA
ncbi:hypothetical protein ABH915_002683 [Arthrobacter sp. MW3 TE3886]